MLANDNREESGRTAIAMESTRTDASNSRIRGAALSDSAARRLRLLLVEDSDADAALFGARLKATSFIPAPECLRARNIVEARTMLVESHPDCVLLDLGLPDAIGVGGVQTLRSVDAPPAILVLTGLDDEETALAAMKAGAQDYVVKDHAEGPLLVRAILRSMQRHKIVAELADHSRDLDYQANHDALTGLWNRRGLDARFRERCSHPATDAAVVLMDLNGFKPVNDRHGHAAGDAVLLEVANRLRLSIRDQDAAARIGGDEFALLTLGALDVIPALVERVRAAIAAPISVDGRSHVVTSSIGVAILGRDGSALAALLEAADRRMYADKQAIKSRGR